VVQERYDALGPAIRRIEKNLRATPRKVDRSKNTKVTPILHTAPLIRRCVLEIDDGPVQAVLRVNLAIESADDLFVSPRNGKLVSTGKESSLFSDKTCKHILWTARLGSESLPKILYSLKH